MPHAVRSYFGYHAVSLPGQGLGEPLGHLFDHLILKLPGLGCGLLRIINSEADVHRQQGHGAHPVVAIIRRGPVVYGWQGASVDHGRQGYQDRKRRS